MKKHPSVHNAKNRSCHDYKWPWSARPVNAMPPYRKRNIYLNKSPAPVDFSITTNGPIMETIINVVLEKQIPAISQIQPE